MVDCPACKRSHGKLSPGIYKCPCTAQFRVDKNPDKKNPVEDYRVWPTGKDTWEVREIRQGVEVGQERLLGEVRFKKGRFQAKTKGGEWRIPGWISDGDAFRWVVGQYDNPAKDNPMGRTKPKPKHSPYDRAQRRTRKTARAGSGAPASDGNGAYPTPKMRRDNPTRPGESVGLWAIWSGVEIAHSIELAKIKRGKYGYRYRGGGRTMPGQLAAKNDADANSKMNELIKEGKTFPQGKWVQSFPGPGHTPVSNPSPKMRRDNPSKKNTYKIGFRQDKKLGTLAKLSGLDMPWAAVVQDSETHLIIKVPGHSYWSGYSLSSNMSNTSYEPAEFQVYEKLFGENINSDAPHHNVKWLVSFPVRQAKV
jgi:hypothetical protein